MMGGNNNRNNRYRYRYSHALTVLLLSGAFKTRTGSRTTIMMAAAAREAAVDARTGNIADVADDGGSGGGGEFWDQFKKGDRVPGSAPVDPEESEAPPKISPIKDEDFQNVPYEHGGLLVINDSTGRRLAMRQQRNDGNDEEIEGTRAVIDRSAQYLQDTILAEDKYLNVYANCINKHDLCSFWSYSGQCAQNPNYMIRDEYCLLACNACDKLLAREPAISP
mmetsp:Transcript_29101/g.59056  ORF Transcript_29101/g.59056 Transcript_29101/m.59056 type:complete len:222 (-) Transcript_29101:1257-1922(-)